MQINNSRVTREGDFQVAKYTYTSTKAEKSGDTMTLTPVETNYEFKTNLKVPKLGVMLVGLGGNNGTTFTGGVLANKHNLTWRTKEGVHTPNFYGSITQASTTKVGVNGAEEVFMTMKDILPLVKPENLVISGWDVSKTNIADALERAKVFDLDLQQKLRPYTQDMVPLPAVLYPEFIAANQADRCDNVVPGSSKKEHVEVLRKNLRDFKAQHGLDKVVVMWTANTERRCIEEVGVHDTKENLLKAIENNHKEISASTVYAVACILEHVSFINGSPQNTLVPGVVQLAVAENTYIVGDDFKSGQTKMKTSLTDFLISAGIKPRSIVSYNHLGNNDGKNLSQESTFKSKETSKKGCVDDMLASNHVLYNKEELAKGIDHAIVIKYIPSAGDSKKAIDEYTSNIFMNGVNTISMYNVCEDSLLAAPLILDLILLMEMLSRIEYKVEGDKASFKSWHPVLTFLGYLCKAPLTPKEAPLVNSLPRQKQSIENLFKVCAGIPLDSNLLLEYRTL